MAFCKIAPPTSGTGNATVRIISLKNKSTVPRSQSFTVVSGTGIRRTITVNQEGVKGKYLCLSFPNTDLSQILEVGQSFFVSLDGPDEVISENTLKIGTIKSFTSGQIIIDLSGYTDTDIDLIYDELNTESLSEQDLLYFGVGVGDDPTAQWFPVVKTTETSGAAGTYNYASEYVAESISQSYNGTPITLNCTAV